MSKILAVADIHINDYANRNPENRYRLYQGSRKVASLIIEAGKKYGCSTIVLAGDIVEKCVIRPYVQAEVKLFLDTIMANFNEGYIVWGNHDLDGKSVDQDISDACLGVMLPQNLHYAHKKIVNIGGNTFGFCNWMPEFDLTWIPGKVDVLFTHATICYSVDENSGRLFESQKLDESKFDLAICGDIHKRGQIGKYVSIGCAQRCKLGDPEESSAVVLDCDTKSWQWIDLDPRQELMKFTTTTDMDAEGWHEDENTWYVFKQDNTFTDQNGKISVDAWTEINALTEDAIQKSGLGVVHQEILNNISNVDAGEVDFNFTLRHLHCENWRSIESLDVDFRHGDKILIQGSNGSGKSSFLSALRYALCDVSDEVGISSLKSFISFGKKDCVTEVEFEYQGNYCKIQRGTKTYGLWINGEQMKYNEKRMFEKDCRDRFPFTRYIDAFFYNSDRTSFLRSLSPERVTEITSKFLKLNRIDTYNETARLLYEQFKVQFSERNTKLKETQKLLQYIQDKLSSLTLPSLSRAQLEQMKQEGLEIQRQNNAWNQYMNSSARLQAQLQTAQDQITSLEQQKLGFRDQSLIDKEIVDFQAQIQYIQGLLVDLGNIRVNLDYKMKEYENLRVQGNQAWQEAQEIGIGKTCSHCGQVIKNSEALENHKRELLQKVEDIKPQIYKLQEEIQNLMTAKENSDSDYTKWNSDIVQLNQEISSRMTEKENQNTVLRNLEFQYSQVQKVQADISALGVVPRVDLPDHFMEKMADIENGIVSWGIFETTENDRKTRELELSQYQAQVQQMTDAMSQLEAYIKLTGPTGVIFEEIFNKLADQFSSNTIKYKVIRKGKGAREHLSLVPHYNNSGNLVSIDFCSSGQRTILDIDYISKVMGANLPYLSLDEYTKNLDQERFEEVLDILKSMNIGCLMLTSHAESIPAFNNKSMLFSLDSNSKTQIIFK